MRKVIAEQFIRFIWKPRAGDQVLVKKIKTQIDFIHEGNVYVAAFPAQAFRSSELRYRPTPQDYLEALNELSSLFKYRELKSLNHPNGFQVVGINIQNRSVICLKGRPRKILLGVLELRGLDARINEAVNQLVFSRCGSLPTGGLHFAECAIVRSPLYQ